MKHLLLGAGLQGTAIAFDLLRDDRTVALTVLDRDAAALERLRERLADPRLRTVAADVLDEAAVGPLLREADVAVSAVNYWFNATLAGWAVRHHAHFLDLGGNNDVVRQELALDAEARRAGVTIVPDCGLAPGLAGILGYRLQADLDEVDSLRLRVGGLPLRPEPPLDYMIVFAVQGLINEYVEPCLVIRDGQVGTVPGLSELETLRFPEPFGELEAFQTSGGTSTLPQTLGGRVRNLDYKTIRYPGHCERFRLLLDLGLLDSRPLAFRGAEFAPRDFTALMLERALPQGGDDVVLVQIEAEGRRGGRAVRRRLRIVDYPDREHGISAMMRTTGYPAAIIAAMLGSGEIAERGARPQELVVPGERFEAELERRGIRLQREEETLGG